MGSLLPGKRGQCCFLCADSLLQTFPTNDTKAMAAGVCFPHLAKRFSSSPTVNKTHPSAILSIGNMDGADSSCSSPDRHYAQYPLLALINSGVLNSHRQAFVCSFLSRILFSEHLGVAPLSLRVVELPSHQTTATAWGGGGALLCCAMHSQW